MVKRTVLVFMVCLFMLSVIGCLDSGKKEKPVAVVAAGNSQLPSFLVGRWKADGSDWAIKLNKDGSISKITHMLGGNIDLREGGSYLEGKDPNSFAIFILGDCVASYKKSTNLLNVSIELSYFRMEMPIGTLEGSSTDVFSGPVSADGQTWTANWFSYSKLEGADEPDPNLIEANPVSLTFRKVTSE